MLELKMLKRCLPGNDQLPITPTKIDGKFHQANFGSANSFAIILTRHSENLFLNQE